MVGSAGRHTDLGRPLALPGAAASHGVLPAMAWEGPGRRPRCTAPRTTDATVPLWRKNARAEGRAGAHGRDAPWQHGGPCPRVTARRGRMAVACGVGGDLGCLVRGERMAAGGATRNGPWCGREGSTQRCQRRSRCIVPWTWRSGSQRPRRRWRTWKGDDCEQRHPVALSYFLPNSVSPDIIRRSPPALLSILGFQERALTFVRQHPLGGGHQACSDTDRPRPSHYTHGRLAPAALPSQHAPYHLCYDALAYAYRGQASDREGREWTLSRWWIMRLPSCASEAA
jgi:hypothetical protein